MTERIPGRASIVILNWNSGTLGAAAASSALRQTYTDIELIVVDNDSSDDSLALILEVAPEATVIVNDENRGFAGGMNTGFAACGGEYFLPLNCDAALSETYVETLVAVLEADDRAAAAGGLVEESRSAIGPLEVTRTMRTRPLPTDAAIVCSKLNGSCPLFRAAALDQVVAEFGGPYDETYWMYGEDIDVALNLRQFGWRYRFEPSARAEHVRSFGSSRRVMDRRGRVRVSTLANRHRNITRHGGRGAIVFQPFAYVQDVGLVVLQLGRRDVHGAVDVLACWRRALACRREDRVRRRRLLELGAVDGVQMVRRRSSS